MAFSYKSLFPRREIAQQKITVEALIGPFLLSKLGSRGSSTFSKNGKTIIKWAPRHTTDLNGRRTLVITRQEGDLAVQIANPGANFAFNSGLPAGQALDKILRDLPFLTNIATNPSALPSLDEDPGFDDAWEEVISDLITRKSKHEGLIGPLPERPGQRIAEATKLWRHPSSRKVETITAFRTRYTKTEISPPGSRHYVQTLGGENIPVIAGILDDEAVRILLNGGCTDLAIALHEMTGLPIVKLTRPLGKEFNHETHFVHGAIETKDGYYVDANGLSSKVEFLERYKGSGEINLEYVDANRLMAENLDDGVVAPQPNLPLARSFVPSVLKKAGLDQQAKQAFLLISSAMSIPGEVGFY